MAPIEPGAPPSALARQQADPANRLRRRKGTDATLAAPATASGATDATPEVNKGHSDQDAPLGKTPDGTVFKIPQTHNMLTSLFDPRTPKSNIDLLTLFLLGLQLVLFVTLSRPTARIFFGLYFALWRTAYDAGLGYVLKRQSEERWIVRTVKRNGWFDEKRHPKAAQWVKNELKKKMGKTYDFASVPLEFNVWIIFRHGVDVILLNDFLSYVLFSLSFLTWSGPPGHSVLFHVLRWVGGFTLLLFNLWVKTDAHRIVKDFAWYWGDAFFLSLQNLVFDGVFEFAPHPMYSVGYAGYYGLSLIVASPTVLFVSLAAHAAQFGFLLYFENPHIERTYGQRKPIAARVPLPRVNSNSPSDSPASRSRADSTVEPTFSGSSTPTLIEDSATEAEDEVITEDDAAPSPKERAAGRKPSLTPSMFSTRPGMSSRRSSEYELEPQTRHDLDNKYFHKDLLIFRNWDAFRARDLAFALVLLYAVVPPFLPSLSRTSTISLLFLHALAWRAFHSGALGLALKKQSERRWIVRHFIKHYHYEREGDAVRDAFDNWKAIYNLSLCMTYVSFVALAWKSYTIPTDWSFGALFTRHTLGLLLLALQAWSSAETYEVLGPFGWFYGDFWIPDYPHELAVTGIFRFLNNPERSMGGAAFIGIALIAGSKLALAQALINIAAHWWFLSAVENPHMQRLYGNSLRKDAGVTKTLRNAVRRASEGDGLGGSSNKTRKDLIERISKNVRVVQGTVEKVFEETADAVEEFINKSAPAVKGYVKDTKILLQQSGERFVISRVANDLASYDSSQYSLKLRPSAFPPLVPHASTSSAPALRYHLGEPIHVKWTAPSNHSRRDWIGVYRLGANKDKLVTKVSSQGKWVGLFSKEWEGDRYEGVGGGEAPEHGEISATAQARGAVVFKSKKLPWKTGQYEFRYHHDGKHSVVALSEPFEIFVDKPTDFEDADSVHTALTHIVSKTLALDAEVVPQAALPLVEDAKRAQAAFGMSDDEDSSPSTPTERRASLSKGKEKALLDEGAVSPQQRAVPLSDPDDFVLYSTDEAAHIAYAIKCAFDVELDKEVVLAAANVSKLAAQLLEARKVLGVKPGEGGTGMKADLTEP
ncbi:hypothetical protein BMF94_4058 [Rhodotorula taiwanensis]|uniref:Phosphatidylethanolamine N-methyltransferase n=1 Tax=Rhodotorula taiwanensis TaxID=741276 RepID=A0A2S5B808_9BASI|nr:hypothetical protein BMF94_4058 [Rhodotorula taiwanensis]